MKRSLSTILFVSFVGCNSVAPTDVPAPKKPVAISVVALEKAAIRRVIEQPGIIQADEETQMVAKLPGYVKRVLVDIGQRVIGPKFNSTGQELEPGQLLAELSVPELEHEAIQKSALIAKAQAEVEQSRQGVIAAEANVATKESSAAEAKASQAKAQALVTRWQSEAARVGELVTSRVLDDQTRDETNNQLKAAQANFSEAKAKVTSADAATRKAQADCNKAAADLKATEANVEVCRADARRVNALLDYAKIRAPFTGIVTARRINTGDLVAGTSERSWLFTISRLDKVRVVVQVPEADTALIRDKMPADVLIPALRKPAIATTVARTSWSLQPGSRTLRTEMDLANSDELYRPGMYANVSIRADQNVEWSLPVAAVKLGDAPYCFVVVDGKAARAAVQIGRSDSQRIEILKLRLEGETEWRQPTSADQFATPTTGLVNGAIVSK